MSNQFETLIAWIKAELLFQPRVHVYLDRNKDPYLEYKIDLNNHDDFLGSYGRQDEDDEILKRLSWRINKLIEGGRIPSSLGNFISVMRKDK